MNRLQEEKSPYLRHASHQEIDWYPWCDEPFERAAKEEKPIFLSSGAVWCHWCHVMARESFEDQEVAALLNEYFINIKLDRDERPDIDRRYQRAAAIGGASGGWPLSVFLSPDRKPFFIGTYFPPTDAYGLPGFKRLLRTIVDLYRTRRDELVAQAEKVAGLLAPKHPGPEPLSRGLIEVAVGNLLSQFDLKNGGFGGAPKFPMSGAIDFLLQRYSLSPDPAIAGALRRTLEAMAKGGFYDQVGGGFHRYSTDELWLVPHFEKMADDNAWLLKNYLDGYVVLGDPFFREVAEGIVGFLITVLGDKEGGFYASQDADVVPEEEGGYFTWSDADFTRVLSAEENHVLSLHLMDGRAVLPHDPKRRVLFIASEAEAVAKKLDLPVERVKDLIASGREKLLKERAQRQAPYIDDTLYTALNGMVISALFKAYRVLGDRGIEEACIKGLARIMRENMAGDRLHHCPAIDAMLDDYAFLIEALVSAYEATGIQQYLDMAQELMETCIGRFWDETEGGFFDTAAEVLGVRLKGVEDIPHPSANSQSIMNLISLSLLLDSERYRTYAKRCLEAFVPTATQMGVHGGFFFSALDAYFHPLKLTVPEVRGKGIGEAAFSRVKPYAVLSHGEAPEGSAVPCVGTVCYEPLRDAQDLDRFLKETLPGAGPAA